MVGEETNKLLGYLVMTSRKMDEPLALLLILSGQRGGQNRCCRTRCCASARRKT